MVQVVKSYFYKFTKSSAAALLVFILAGFFIGSDFLTASVFAYLLSYLFVASNFGVIANVDLDDHKQFYRIFFISIGVRFLFIIGALIFVLGVLKFHQIFFTVSFIISYIFHSVNEIIFLNKILETDT